MIILAILMNTVLIIFGSLLNIDREIIIMTMLVLTLALVGCKYIYQNEECIRNGNQK